MRGSLRHACRVALFGWPVEPMAGYDMLTVSANWGRVGWRHVLRPYWAARRFLYVMGADV